MPSDTDVVPGRRFGVPGRIWAVVVLLGLVGQVAWTVENMYLNVFIYNTITTDPNVIAITVAASAGAATLATMLVGAWSDRARTRRPFIAFGYVVWGVLTALFGVIRPGADTAAAIAAAAIAVVALDCVMSFFGSGANDAAFNAWITDSTVPGNRGRVESVLAIMPLISMLLVFGALDGLTRAGEWTAFFGTVGGLVSVVGVIGWFLVRDASTLAPPTEGYLTTVLHGLRPASIRENPRLYVLLTGWAVMGTSTQVFLPYLIIYIQRYLKIEGYAIVLASVLVLASVISVLGGRVIDRIGKVRAILPSVTIMVVGLVGMFFARGMLPVIVIGTVMMGGFMLSAAAFGASVRDATPTDRVGMVQGLRMIAMVLVPMVLGPFIGASVILGANETYTDLGVVRQVPTPWVFPAAAVGARLTRVPVGGLRRGPARRAGPGARGRLCRRRR